MSKLRLLVELDYDAVMWEGDLAENRQWFFEQVLLGPDLILHDNEVGDDIGALRVLEIEPNANPNSQTPEARSQTPSNSAAK